MDLLGLVSGAGYGQFRQWWTEWGIQCGGVCGAALAVSGGVLLWLSVPRAAAAGSRESSFPTRAAWGLSPCVYPGRSWEVVGLRNQVTALFSLSSMFSAMPLYASQLPPWSDSLHVGA